MENPVTNSVSDKYIHTGFWINWSYGSIKGATITLNNRDGGLLTAFLALFVTLVGRSFWRLFCFAVHFVFSARSPQDGLHHQRQVILRNAATGLQGLEHLVQLTWSWRARSRKPILRMIPLIGLAAFITAAFYVSSIFSSRISTAIGDAVLVSSPRCGLLTADAASSLEEFYGDIVGYSDRLQNAAASYAQQCYQANATASECSVFVERSIIPPIISTGDTCPFPGKERICRRSSTNLRVDTGVLDSHKYFGMNSAPQCRFGHRRVHQCASLLTDGYTEEGTAFASNPKSQYATNQSQYNDTTGYAVLRYFYGGGSGNSTRPTYAYPVSATAFNPDTADYVIDVENSYAPEPDLHPIPELQSNTSDLFLAFLSANNIRFLEPVDDDMFSAHEDNFPLQAVPGNEGADTPTYKTDQPATVLGCAVQYQFCNQQTKKCTSLSNIDQAHSETQNLWSSARQQETFDLWYQTYLGLPHELWNVLESLRANALVARNTMAAGIQGPLPPDQWHQEVLYWHAVSMATLQRTAVEMATGPFDASMDKYVQKLSGDAQSQVCQNQKVRSTAHTSFSVLGLSLTIALGGLIIVISHVAEPLLRLLQRWRRIGIYRRLEWTTNETLQLHRMAHEEIGSGGKWARSASSVPVTEKGQLLNVLDIDDESHPVLSTASAIPPGPMIEEKLDDLSPSTTSPDDEEARIGVSETRPAKEDVGASPTSTDASGSYGGVVAAQTTSQRSDTPLIHSAGESTPEELGNEQPVSPVEDERR